MLGSLSEWNTWWSDGRVPPELLGRPRELSERADELLSFREIKTLTGLRRSGKSTLLYQFVDHLLRGRSVPPRRVLMINFEDPVLSHRPLADVFDEYRSKIEPSGRPYLFLDEVHLCPDWVRFLRRLYDLRQVEQAFLTDSSSQFVRPEFSGVLTGRQVNVTVRPLSFREFLAWRGLRAGPLATSAQVQRIRHALEEYLRWGGLPEVVLKSSDTQRKILLGNYLADIVHRDVVERHRAEYPRVRELVDHLVSNPGALFSPRKYSRSSGLSLDALHRYLGYLVEVFLVETLPRFSRSLRGQQVAPKKVYLTDLGFFGALGFRLSEGTGHRYENVVFQALRGSGREVYYWRGRWECDFVVKDGPRIEEAIQVCARLEPESEARELRGLLEAMSELKIERGTIVNEGKEGTERVNGRTVRFVPLWKFLTSLGGHGT